jgi:hypothetical protein
MRVVVDALLRWYPEHGAGNLGGQGKWKVAEPGGTTAVRPSGSTTSASVFGGTCTVNVVPVAPVDHDDSMRP